MLERQSQILILPFMYGSCNRRPDAVVHMSPAIHVRTLACHSFELLPFMMTPTVDGVRRDYSIYYSISTL